MRGIKFFTILPTTILKQCLSNPIIARKLVRQPEVSKHHIRYFLIIVHVFFLQAFSFYMYMYRLVDVLEFIYITYPIENCIMLNAGTKIFHL